MVIYYLRYTSKITIAILLFEMGEKQDGMH